MAQLVYTNVRLSRDTWKAINFEREPNESLDEALKRILDERKRYRRMIKTQGDSTLA